MEGKRKVRKEGTHWVRSNERKGGKTKNWKREMKRGSWVCSWKVCHSTHLLPYAGEGLSVKASDKLALY